MASFHTFFVQVAPSTETSEPMILPIRAVASEAARDKMREMLKDVPQVVEVVQNEAFVISATPKDAAKIKRGLENTISDELGEMDEFSERSERTRRDMFNYKKEHTLSEQLSKEWNKLRWVRFMKKISGIPIDELYHQGTIIKKDEDAAIAAADADLLGCKDQKMIVPTAPPKELIKEQYMLAVIHPDSDDRTGDIAAVDGMVEPVMQICGVYATQEMAEETAEDLDGTTYCIAKTGGWLKVLQPIWAQWEMEVSYDDPVMNKMLSGRKNMTDQNERAKKNIKKQEVESYGRACEYATKLGMHVDNVIDIAKDPKGKQELLDLLYIQDRCCMEDAVDDILDRYLGIKNEI
jgi:hypothetical protein